MDPDRHRAKHLEQIRPLIQLCNEGRLFEVQRWAAAGSPLNLPGDDSEFPRKTVSPLGIAVQNGFHSLAEVLLKAGADPVDKPHNYVLNTAIRAKRMDLVELLILHGADLSQLNFITVYTSVPTLLKE